ncbi:hypothetical protein H0H92_011080 [Tricholoma furcatifolium]|nr:hypothetical protein H0H92_011080 [Tricholoma furcatifolium]
MRSAIGYLEGKAWGEDWISCVEALVNFEEVRGFLIDDGRLSTDQWPAAISSWMHGKRHWMDVEIDDGFATAWLAWWSRLKEGGDMNIVKLAKGRANGLLLVVIGLAWWGNEVDDVSHWDEGDESWGWAVRDVWLRLEVLKEQGVAEGKDDDLSEGNAEEVLTKGRKVAKETVKAPRKNNKRKEDDNKPEEIDICGKGMTIRKFQKIEQKAKRDWAEVQAKRGKRK